ncbi:MAG: hypothetical protein ABEJ40_02605, partial [Haloarculaceae archaeon]
MTIGPATETDRGLSIETERGTLALEAYADNVVRMAYTPGTVPDPESPVVVEQDPFDGWTARETADGYEVAT